MCGITGIAFAKVQPLDCIFEMTASLRHRGPDDGKTWIDTQTGIALGHRRLAIIDLSQEGQQPMESTNKRYIIVLNGEIYNFLELKKELTTLGSHFRGHSDTEVLLEAVSKWGIDSALKRATGMFAFALWDKHEHKLYLARDRFGEKPLYYAWMNGTFIFASELKALKKFKDWHGEIDRNALASYLRYGYVPTPHSIYKNIHKLTPGTFLTISENTQLETIYWSAEKIAEQGLKNPLKIEFQDATNLLEQQLKETIQLQMVADVPLGAFLSGGIDSSTIVALMQAQSSHPIKTFSIGFEKQAFDEAPFAKAIAKHLQTDHTELYVSTEDAMQVVPLLSTLYDEPFADSSQIPTYLVSKLAKEQVTVSLSGDGGDELFGGYKRYPMAQNFWNKLNKLPFPTRKIIGKLLQLGTGVLPYSPLAQKAQRLIQLLQNANCESALNRMLISAIDKPNDFVVQGNEYPEMTISPLLQENFIEMMMYNDTKNYLLDDILTKVDRAGMAVSLESRIPFLDHHVYELAWQIPLAYKVQGGQGKIILKEVLNRYVPKALFERPKMGFGIPLNLAEKPLREWAEELLAPQHLREQGYFNVERVQNLWQGYLKGNQSHQAALWYILMFNDWLKVN